MDILTKRKENRAAIVCRVECGSATQLCRSCRNSASQSPPCLPMYRLNTGGAIAALHQSPARSECQHRKSPVRWKITIYFGFGIHAAESLPENRDGIKCMVTPRIVGALQYIKLGIGSRFIAGQARKSPARPCDPWAIRRAAR